MSFDRASGDLVHWKVRTDKSNVTYPALASLSQYFSKAVDFGIMRGCRDRSVDMLFHASL